jgi:ABC-type phosphate transport system substrate-binding protein
VRTLYSLTVLLLLAAALAPAATAARDAAPFVLVAHPDVPRGACDEKTVLRIYLGKKTRWEGGLPVVPAVLRDGALHEAFVERMLDRTVSRFEIYWKQAVFTGRGIPPRSFATETELMAFVADTPGAVGYVSRGTPLKGVKVIACE